MAPSNFPADMAMFAILPPKAPAPLCNASKAPKISLFRAFWLSAASTAADGELGGGGSMGGGGTGGGGEGEVATSVSGGFTVDTVTLSNVERDSTVLVFSSLKASAAVAGEVVLIVNVIVLP